MVLLAGCSKRGPGGDAAGTGGAASGGGAIGTQAPAFALPDLDARTVKSEEFAGKVVLLDFWATWCPPCRAEIPHLVRLQSKYRDRGLAIVGLSLDQGGAGVVRPFADEHEINYAILIANDGTAESYGGIVGIPTTFLIDRDGKIVRRFVGYTDPDVFEQAIVPLLGPAG
jgi:peroxiredoxin